MKIRILHTKPVLKLQCKMQIVQTRFTSTKYNIRTHASVMSPLKLHIRTHTEELCPIQDKFACNNNQKQPYVKTILLSLVVGGRVCCFKYDVKSDPGSPVLTADQ